MTKADLVREVQSKLPIDLTQKQISMILSISFNVIRNHFIQSDNPRFNIRGFGTFVRKDYGGHKFFNPKALEFQSMELKSTIKFLCSKILRQKL